MAGAPSPVAPVLATAGVAAAAGLVVRALAAYWSRRKRSHRVNLPRGMVVALFRPPQFSL